ncbi:UNVERIFIED_CONTAM: Transposon Ty3-I Gag-Pol polyprotein [Sesamum radiatum]|uniref:Transposon Ty3-I Gag-Pol polyprotein n=1 Tax=Sesamum radiatum TaxID=300843 RepID=A0AAW2S7C0_SESRA
MSQLASSVSKLESQGKLPSQTVVNSKQNATAIVLHSGKELQENTGKNGTKHGHTQKRKPEKKVEIPEDQDDEAKQDNLKVLVTRPLFSERFTKSNKEEEEKEIFETIHKAPTLELKELLKHLKYAYLGENNTLPTIILSNLTPLDEEKLIRVLREFKKATGWTIADIKSVSPSTCTHRILLEQGTKLSRAAHRRLNPPIKEVVKKEILKLLDADMFFPISDSQWVSPTQVVPKKMGITVVENSIENLVPTRVQNGWRVCIDYRKFNAATRKDHFPLLFIDQMLEKLASRSHYCCLDGYSGFHQIPIAPADQDKTTFTCPFGTFPYRRMPFGLCNHPLPFKDVCVEVLAIKERSKTPTHKIYTLTTRVLLTIKDKKGAENLVADHLSRLVTNDDPSILNNEFPDEHLPLGVDNVSKWVEAKATRTDDAKTVVEFVKANIFFRFRMLRAIISDRGTHFCNKVVDVLLKKYNVTHRISTAYHPQTNGQAEIFNRDIKSILEKIVNPNRNDWSTHLDDALWAYRTTYKTSIGKMQSRWIGSFIVTNIFPNGAVEIKSPTTHKVFKVNRHRLKPFYEDFQEPTMERIQLIGTHHHLSHRLSLARDIKERRCMGDNP